MFGDEDHVAGISGLDRLHPLAGVEAIGIDLIPRCGTIIAFAPLIDIGRPMEEQTDPRLVPRNLLRSGHGKIHGAFRCAPGNGWKQETEGER